MVYEAYLKVYDLFANLVVLYAFLSSADFF